MRKSLTTLLVLAVLVCVYPACAQETIAPKPADVPARVPFTAFRVKPILAPQLKEKAGSLVVQDTDKKTYKPRGDIYKIPTSSPKPAAKKIKIDQAPPVIATNIPVPLPKPDQLQKLIADTVDNEPWKGPSKQALQMAERQVEDVSLAVPPEITPDIPVPPVADVKPTPPPVASVMPDDTPTFGTNAGTVRIRPDRSRFSSSDRMAGANTQRMASLGLPSDMQNLRVGALHQGKGISPVLLPGYSVTVAAPDRQAVDKRGLPAEVIVFFQENSAELEVGQMDIINNDVIATLLNRPELDVEIVGYSEEQADDGDATQKMALSRALMIREYLTRKRISANRLTVKGKGRDTKIEPRDRVEMYFSQ